MKIRGATGSSRPLHFESLENRRLLTLFTISQLTDEPVAAAGDAPGTLRQALFDANSRPGADTIDFQNGLTGTITLTAGELKIADELTLLGPGPNQLTVDATGNDLTSPGTADGSGSRVLNIDDGDNLHEIPIEISGLTLTGGDVSGNGGAIRSLENLTLSRVTIQGNSATGATARGGGIFSFGGDLSISRSTISGNVASGTSADGGGIFSETKVFGVQTTSIADSTLSGNQAGRNGGGINTRNNLLENQTTVVLNSTISGNTATNAGGGIFNFDGTTSLRHSTVTDNSAASDSGGGVASYGDLSTSTTILSSIISGNLAGDDLAVVSGTENTLLSGGFNVLGTGNTFGATNQFSALDNFGASGNQTGVFVPGLESLADNGGPTFTHALLLTSPALDAGDPDALPNLGSIPEFDQRGALFGRVSDGNNDSVARIDVGAFEFTTQSAEPSADFDIDGDVDGNDFLLWQRGFDKTSAAREDGDADNNEVVNGADLLVWSTTYGDQTTPLSVVHPLPVTNLSVTKHSAARHSAAGQPALSIAVETNVPQENRKNTLSLLASLGSSIEPLDAEIATIAKDQQDEISPKAIFEAVDLLFERLADVEFDFSEFRI